MWTHVCLTIVLKKHCHVAGNMHTLKNANIAVVHGLF